MLVGIHPDDYTGPGRPAGSDAASPRWAEHLLALGHEVRWVDVYRSDILRQLENCDGFMWRHNHGHLRSRIARRLLPVVEYDLGLLVYPDQHTCWHYDDKIAQSLLFEAHGIPSPRTWVCFDEKESHQIIQDASYPLVIKLSTGAGSKNVALANTPEDALSYVRRMFGEGVFFLSDASEGPWGIRRRLRAAVKAIILGRPAWTPPAPRVELHRDYVLLQEFIPNNEFDTRVTVIGDRAFAFRRFNRPNDFRASGSGRIDWDVDKIPEKVIRLAFRTARCLGMQSCALDVLYRGTEPLVGEVSFTYVSSAVYACPGHWRIDGPSEDGQLVWQAGQIWPEEAQVTDFVDRWHRSAAAVCGLQRSNSQVQ